MTVPPALARAARAEWGSVVTAVRDALASRRLAAVPLTLFAVALTACLHLAQNQPWGRQPVEALGSVTAGQPLWLALLRTPLSVFVPALDLPVWGALAQVLLVFGVAEVCLGRWWTPAVAYAATLAGTAYARLGVALGPHSPVGLPAPDAWVVDTGPSAAVIGLALCVCWRHRARVTGALVAAAMVVEVLVEDNLAGREHLAALAVVAAGCALAERWRGPSGRGTRRRGPSGGGTGRRGPADGSTGRRGPSGDGAAPGAQRSGAPATRS
ncbi:hypothetical protein [Streptomyces sp. URMC 123]|uniref:hypothetical protein n=1 Tax=Streptomyces sp. URMC 123 TaxID=3423403 RepID=UPI003F19A5B1